MRRREIVLPVLPDNFAHAYLNTVSVGPRREVTLEVMPLVWQGSSGHRGEAVRVRFGGVENLAEVTAFFAANGHCPGELAWLMYSTALKSQPGCLYFELMYERIDARLVVQCSSLQMSGFEECGRS